MADYIERQAAIDYCYQLINVEHQRGSDEMNYGRERVAQTETILHHLEFMPSADVQPVRHGSWIEDRYNDLDFVCSECGEPCANMVMGMPRDRYCKWCGARMDFEKGDKEK